MTDILSILGFVPGISLEVEIKLLVGGGVGRVVGWWGEGSVVEVCGGKGGGGGGGGADPLWF